jgi:hypothetical protein
MGSRVWGGGGLTASVTHANQHGVVVVVVVVHCVIHMVQAVGCSVHKRVCAICEKAHTDMVHIPYYARLIQNTAP